MKGIELNALRVEVTAALLGSGRHVKALLEVHNNYSHRILSYHTNGYLLAKRML